MAEQKETITIAVWRDDWQKLKDLCVKDETYRKKFHEVMEEIYKGIEENSSTLLR